MYNLIFFVLILLVACNNQESNEIRILWNNKQAAGISIPKKLVGNTSADSIGQFLKVGLAKDSNAIPIFGEYNIQATEIVFKPLIPFSRGLHYSVLFKNKRIGEVEIPSSRRSGAPTLLAIYPTRDTLPENLLKIYLQFSQPMREGESQKHIALIKNDRDTLHDIFLNLQPELWNHDRTVLTIWLDPGRIKRDLQPNKRLGNPLKQGEWYKLAVSDKWEDIQGLRLRQAYTRKFFVSSRDSISPDPGKWLLGIPPGGSVKPFEADLRESLDYFLLKETVSVIDEKGLPVKGNVQISDKEKRYLFIPVQNWAPGNYTLEVETRLEDLAGNNINRVFDRDINSKKTPGSKAIFKRQFHIK
jgi:hypothetical protein